MKIDVIHHMMRKAFILIAVLAAAFALASCSSHEATVPTAWEHVTLPLAPHLESLDDSHPGVLSLTIDETGSLSLYGAALTQSNLVGLAHARYEQYGRFPVIVFCDANTTFDKLWPPIQKLREMGWWWFAFAGTKERTANGCVIGTAAFFALVEENNPDQEGAAVLITEGEESESFLVVRLEPSGLKLNGDETSVQELDQHYQEHAGELKMVTIVLIPSPETRYSTIIDMLDICLKHELKNICIMEALDAKPTEPPYPQIEPLEIIRV